MTQDTPLRERLLAIIEKEGMIDREKLTADATLETLNIASFDMVMILMGIEEQCGVYVPVDAQLTEARTLDELLNVLTAKIVSAQSNQGPATSSTPAPGAEAE